MRIFKKPEPQSLKGLAFIICLGVSSQFSDIAKSRSPGSFPEGEVGFPGRGPGRCFPFIEFSSRFPSLSWSFSSSIVPGKCHQNMPNRKNAQSRKLPGRRSGFSRKPPRRSLRVS